MRNIPEVKFAPFKGQCYGRKSQFDISLLVLGESHYDEPDEINQDEGWITEKNNSGECKFTEYVLRRWGQNEPYRFFTMSANVLLLRENGGCRDKKNREIWEHVAFYNYVSSYVPWQDRPSDQQWRASQKPFESVLEKLEPDAVLMLGKELSEWVAYLQGYENFEIYHPYKHEQINYLGICHPRGGLEYSKAVPAFKELLTNTKRRIVRE